MTRVALLMAAVLLAPGLASAAGDAPAAALWRLLTLQDYNTRVVLLGTGLLGAACGLVGTFLVLRRRALLSDAVAHATLPGVVIAWMVSVYFGGEGRSLPVLLLGAAVSGTLGMLTVLGIRSLPRIKDDAAIGIVLSVFFGAGVALLGVATRMGTGNPAGLSSFIYGKAASMVASDVAVFAVAALVIVAVCLALFKEFQMLCFDADFASTQGWPVGLLDALLMGLVVAMTVVGLQAAGLILVVALLVTPAAAARYWARRLGPQTGISAVIGAASAFVGASFSAVYPKLPAGAVIVLTAAAVFVVSMLFGRRGGWLWRRLEAVALGRRVESQHLLRTVFELAEVDGWMEALQDFAVPAERLGREQGWSAARTRRALARASRRDLVCQAAGGGWKLTPEGAIEARAAVRNHRLWELYLLSHADTAPAHVDRGADRIEHILHPALIERLERTLATEYGSLPIPANPHAPPPEPD